MKNWISTKNKTDLPKDEQEVILCIRDTVKTGYKFYKRDSVFMIEDGDYFTINDVDYWMALPEPPK